MLDRLQKVIAAAGVASRRDAEALILAGRVRVDGQPITTLGTKVDPEQASIQVDGRPTVRCKLEYLPPPDFEATTFAEFMVLGMIMTAMPAVNAIPLVVAAPPGIVTYVDLPLPLPRGLVPG